MMNSRGLGEEFVRHLRPCDAESLLIGKHLQPHTGALPQTPKFSSLPRTWAGRETTCAFRSLVALPQSQLCPPHRLPFPSRNPS
jgi:hypothetical protein